MTRTRHVFLTLSAIIVAGLATTAVAQQGVVIQSQASVQQTRPQVTRSYRSYSVSPSSDLRGTIRHSTRHSNEATWRHGDSKAMGNYRSGR